MLAIIVIGFLVTICFIAYLEHKERIEKIKKGD